ncbi:MAG: PDZ domain-containing protein [Elusimicrobia bacterium]|nr:PDZ domain-containing protein [Elusimicrobiota bacterium]
MLRSHHVSLLFMTLGALVGCTNPYRANFISMEDRIPPWIQNRFTPPSKQPRLQYSEDSLSDKWKLFEQGYFMVGYSKFDGKRMDDSLALTKAKSIGANLVLIEKKFSKTMMETVAMTQWTPRTTTEIRDDTTVSGPKGKRDVSRRTEIRTGGDPQVTYVPKRVDYFEYVATFWRKVDTIIFGAFVTGLPDEMKKSLQTNRGLIVRNIVIDSPAYQADLLKDDIILEVNGVQVPGMQKFYENMNTMAGQEVVLTVLRGSQTITKRVKLNR